MSDLRKQVLRNLSSQAPLFEKKDIDHLLSNKMDSSIVKSGQNPNIHQEDEDHNNLHSEINDEPIDELNCEVNHDNDSKIQKGAYSSQLTHSTTTFAGPSMYGSMQSVMPVGRQTQQETLNPPHYKPFNSGNISIFPPRPRPKSHQSPFTHPVTRPPLHSKESESVEEELNQESRGENGLKSHVQSHILSHSSSVKQLVQELDSLNSISNFDSKWNNYFDYCGNVDEKWNYYISYASPNSNTKHNTDIITESKKSGVMTEHKLPQPKFAIQKKSIILVLIHGGGLTALSWAPFTKYFRKINDNVEIFAMDLRDHGQSFDSDQLSMKNFTNDMVHVLQNVYKERWEEVSFVLCGHSLGGAIAVHTAHELDNMCSGAIVLDLVEGTAMETLPYMKQLITSRPHYFRSMKEGINWALKNMTFSPESAAITFPSQLRLTNKGLLTWRTNLGKSEPYWKEWYESLSKLFLSVKAPKLLILAAKDRLDKELMIGEMQGKFQLRIIYASGHYVHEDNPAQCAEIIEHFMERFLRI